MFPSLGQQMFMPFQSSGKSQSQMTAMQAYKKIETEVKMQRHFMDKQQSESTKQCEIHKANFSKNCRQCKKIKQQELNQDNDVDIKDDTKEINEYYYNQGDRGDNKFPVRGENPMSNLNPLLRQNIINCLYYRDIIQLRTYHDVIAEIEKTVIHAETWAAGGQGVPSAIICCLYKLMTMNLTVNQVKGLIEYRSNSFVRCVGFLYIRFACDPNFLWAWMKKYLFDEDEIRPQINQNIVITIGEYVEMLLTDLNYYNTRLPRIPMGIDHAIQAKIVITREKRQRKLINLRIVDLFQKDSQVRALSKQDEEWHLAVIERFEGNLIVVRYIDQNELNETFKGGFETMNLGELEFIPQDDQQQLFIAQQITQGVEMGQIQMPASLLNDVVQEDDQNQNQKSKSRQRSRSVSEKKKKKKQKKHKSKDKKRNSRSKKRSKSNKRSRSRKRSHSQEKKKYNKKSRSRSREKTTMTQYETNKQRQERIQQEIKKKQQSQALANSKADVARIPASYKSSLSSALPQPTCAKQPRQHHSPQKKEEFVNLNPKAQNDLEKVEKVKEKTQDFNINPESLAFQNELKKKYGDASKSQGSQFNEDRINKDYV